MGLTLCNADTQCSEICIIDGTFAWQTVQKHSRSSDEPSSDLTTAAVPDDDHPSDEAALLVPDAVLENGIRPTLMNINFTIPKVIFLFRFFCQI